MPKQKSFFTYVAEMLEQYRTDRLEHQVKEPSKQVPRVRRLERWLPTPGNIIFTLLVVGLLIMTQGVWALPNLAAVPGASATTINYQGRLSDNGGTPLSGSYNLDFAIYDAPCPEPPAPCNTNLVWGPESHSNVEVTDGLFSVGLSIPTTTWDGDRYLEITVNDEALTPREQIRSVPIAGMALTVPDGAIGTGQIADGAVGAEKIAGGAVGTENLQDEATTQMVYVNSSTPATHDAPTTTTFQDMLDMTVNITTNGGPVLINFYTHYKRSLANGAGAVFRLKIDGTSIDDSVSTGRVMGANQAHYAHLVYATELPAGTYDISIEWRMSSFNATGTLASDAYRQLSVIEFKK